MLLKNITKLSLIWFLSIKEKKTVITGHKLNQN